MVSEDAANKRLQQVLAEVERRAAGRRARFADAMAAHPRRRSRRYYIGILRSAELTGHLDAVLEQLADYIERDLEATPRDQVGAAPTRS